MVIIMNNLILPIILVAVLGYLLGSVSFSIIFTKIFKKDDIRKFGSGNAGATNVLRAVGKKAAALTFIFDFVKCAIAVIVGTLVLSAVCVDKGVSLDLAKIGTYIAGFSCVIGHMFPLYFGFRGGKGVVTTTAMMAMIDWRVFLCVLAIFALVFAWKKTVSLGSIIAAGVYPIFTFLITYLLDYQNSPVSSHGEVTMNYLIAVTVISALTGAVVIIKHHSNIKRLIEGTEKPISFKK